MCGIVGMAGDLTLDRRKAFHDMLMVCQVRGRDSTGAFRVAYNGYTDIAKAVGTPDYLLGTKRYDQNINMFGKALVGHCRAKTFGAANYENAHPFKHGDLTGVHNGSLRGWQGMPGARDFGTDSEWLYWWASEEGMANVLPEIEFCGALVWWDDSEDTLNFYRNEERPLWLTYSEDLKVMLWASEFWMFGPYSRANKLWTPKEGQSLYSSLEPHKIFSYKINHNGREGKDVFTLSVKDVKAKEPEVRGNAGNRTGTINRGAGGAKGGEVTSPFGAAARAASTFMEKLRGTDLLDDDLSDLGRPQNQQGPIQTPAASGNIPTSGSSSSKSSSNVLDFRMGTTGSSSGRKPTLSLPSPSSKTSRQGSKDVIVTDFVNCTESSKKAKEVSFRTVLGVPMISCLHTSREWTEQTFEDATDGICNYCKAAIGDLDEVHRIFIRKFKDSEEEITFICSECVKDTNCG